MSDLGNTAPAASVLRASLRTPMPWRNGGGVTREVAVGTFSGPDVDTPSWRISIATIDRPAVFSSFTGVQRHLMPLDVDGLELLVDGIRVDLPQFETLTFDGATPVEVATVQAVSRDLNLMTSGSATGALTCEAVTGELTVRAGADEIVVLIAVDGEIGLAVDSAGESVSGLSRHDAVELRDCASATLVGFGQVALARVSLAN